MIKNGTFVVVTTGAQRRGVFAGELVSNDGSGNIELKDARMCVYWSRETHGVLGLAAKGPQNGSRITPSVPSIKLDGVSSVMEATDKARAAWEAEPWTN